MSFTCMITDQIGQHKVLLPINHNHVFNFQESISNRDIV